MSAGRLLLILLRVGGGLQVVLGIAFWTGHLYQYLGVHRAIGVGFVAVLWAVAALAMMDRDRRGLALFAIAWGLVIAALGFAQQRLVPGDWHWIVRVAHLAIGIAAIPIAERLSKRATAASSAERITGATAA